MLLEIDNLSVQFGEGNRAARAVNGVSLRIAAGETVGLVGESGSGKSVTGMSTLRLLEGTSARVTSGQVLWKGKDVLGMSPRELRHLRGQEIGMVFQEPMTSFNPVFTIGNQLAEAIRVHESVTEGEAASRAVEMLREVGIPLPEERMEQYPHELSGGMKQRAMIAMALLCQPDLLLADEPTTALDVTVQAQILDLLKRLQERHGMAILIITHDLAVVAETVRRVYVMYASRIVEQAGVEELFDEPLHPYTKGLFRCLPGIGGRGEKLHVIPGSVPDPSQHPTGCRFHPRCPLADTICREVDPPLEVKRPGRTCACHMVAAEGVVAEPASAGINGPGEA